MKHLERFLVQVQGFLNSLKDNLESLSVSAGSCGLISKEYNKPGEITRRRGGEKN
jgi:hypothetical protein